MGKKATQKFWRGDWFVGLPVSVATFALGGSAMALELSACLATLAGKA